MLTILLYRYIYLLTNIRRFISPTDGLFYLSLDWSLFRNVGENVLLLEVDCSNMSTVKFDVVAAKLTLTIAFYSRVVKVSNEFFT